MLLWVCFEFVLRLFCGCFVVVLRLCFEVVFWGCFGFVLGLFWVCFEVVLGLLDIG